MQLRNTQILELDRIFRLNLINSVSGVKPANLIGTISSLGQTNLAIFSSVIHLGSDPALLGLMVRPSGDVRRHTYENIVETGSYTINHVSSSFVEMAHYTSAKFPKDISEFDACGFGEEYVTGVEAPFVRESHIRLGMRFEEEIPIRRNGTSMIIGSIELAIVPDDIQKNDGHLDLERSSGVGISGLNSYYRLEKIAQFPYARPDELPEFSSGSNSAT